MCETFREDSRIFSECLSIVGYHGQVIEASFVSPNFSLMADTVELMVLPSDPSSNIPGDIETESDRVIFVNHVCEVHTQSYLPDCVLII